ncbi:bifunctional diaminohydroxyphosphoribosylaminopyrimidine deaminase/5-amino-6-(5-phosphoribosylamino)uracil reductase RibD [Sphaerotilus sp.]|uniref:bifunctional diaminohydroxyphosphoribosylaminopyrimidine deaminase/5-amino-6-(5-phosphoribosylamino)uracil reductase RibD n=1 Tax=Sphaerotilus sp. TaxID=2093942 RepID=UPI002ACDE1A2|nr:bifunctional diaminohydroxyphosphoribosylaminopyrimidine deaminase/5-amino-6-(5-phosphoribosylamino)uracil reductase RibD [Sphaerotilus sp.]MDZ7858391.1 bifunctional diaminohydroxyphosphoribosylaminopyrimidine deaminase/5-amino-6-(5-phosphoribosylamino)uracil reductase RibD [Sphaerotilus sp.]
MRTAPTPTFSAHDQVAMAQALTWAEQAIGLTDPNPRVGCVISDGQGRVLGAGHTQQAGGPHAEVMAIRAALADGHDLRGATVHVTLEPCAHHGRTPPCADALVAAGVGRVVAAVLDPNPLVAGQGLARLQAAGIAVAHGLMADAARELNIGFFSRMLRGRPWVRLKVAASLDGRTALPDGTSQWITGPQARADGHAWRRRAGAVLTGIGTVREDNPRLDVRLVPTARQPLRIVLDARLDTPPTARLLEAPGEVVLVCAASALHNPRASALARANVTLEPVATDPNGWIDLPAVLDALGRRGVNELHIEAGQHLNGSFVRAGLVDEYLVYLAPRLLGAGRDMAAFGPLAQIADAAPLVFTDITRVGADVRLMARSATAFGSPA